MRGMVVGEGGRSSGVLQYKSYFYNKLSDTNNEVGLAEKRLKHHRMHQSVIPERFVTSEVIPSFKHFFNVFKL